MLPHFPTISTRLIPGLMIVLLTCQLSALAAYDPALLSRIPSITAADKKALNTNKILVGETAIGNNQRFVFAKVLIPRDMDAVFETFWNQQGLYGHAPNFKSVKVLRRKRPNWQDVAYQLKLLPLFPTYDYTNRIEYFKDKQAITFKQIKGPFKEFRGFVKLLPTNKPNQTYMVYGLRLDPGFIAPQPLVRSVLKNDLPETMRHIRDFTVQTHPVSR